MAAQHRVDPDFALFHGRELSNNSCPMVTFRTDWLELEYDVN